MFDKLSEFHAEDTIMPGSAAWPPLSEAARTLTVAHTQGVLSTLTTDDGYPYGSVVDYLPVANGDVVLLLSDLAEHQHYLSRDPRVSLLIAPGLGNPDMLAEARLTLLGKAAKISDRAQYRADYLAKHPQASRYIDFADFNFYRLQVERVRYIAGFGRMGWLDATDYASASPDPLAAMATGAIAHMNEDHQQNLRDYAHAFTGLDWVSDCRMTALDRFGFDLLCTDGDRTERVRIGFDEALINPNQLRPTVLEMANQARAILSNTAQP
ncbi:MAG: DUF2470 domain-containing protein [Candidatus Competibacteraceae bacterium]|jgi:putative heme iron utilization protein|nr:DUF2470 domain-containing protein [Candidatus Competibacteraceae bacterium]